MHSKNIKLGMIHQKARFFKFCHDAILYNVTLCNVNPFLFTTKYNTKTMLHIYQRCEGFQITNSHHDA